MVTIHQLWGKGVMTKARRIRNRQEFIEFAREIRVRPDWHEPDGQNITARVEGQSFDNAGFFPGSAHPGLDPRAQELCVIFSRTEFDDELFSGARVIEDIAVVNLATLCAWATGTDT